MTGPEGQFSFTRARRLDGPHAFAAVFAHRCAVRGALFQVYAKPNGSPGARLGVVMSKRVAQRAVVRNYAKRLVREVFRAEHDVLPGLDVVVRPRVAITRAMSGVARLELRDLLILAHRQCTAAL